MAFIGNSKTLLISFVLALGTCFPVLAEAPAPKERPPLAELWVQTSAETGLPGRQQTRVDRSQRPT